MFLGDELKPELRRVGNSQSPLVVIDEFTGDAESAARLADALAPFPPDSESYYPGVRRLVDEADPDAFAFMQACCRDAAQFIAGAFDLDGFELLRASFSIISTPPSGLSPPQRAPHFDSTDQNYLALLLYLRVPPGTGTAFYRQRSTGIERVTGANVDAFMRAATGEISMGGYIHSSNAFFEQIGAIEALPDRLVIYQGSLLHSGIVQPGMTLSADPREGRLTANLFVRGN